MSSERPAEDITPTKSKEHKQSTDKINLDRQEERNNELKTLNISPQALSAEHIQKLEKIVETRLDKLEVEDLGKIQKQLTEIQKEQDIQKVKAEISSVIEKLTTLREYQIIDKCEKEIESRKTEIQKIEPVFEAAQKEKKSAEYEYDNKLEGFRQDEIKKISKPNLDMLKKDDKEIEAEKRAQLEQVLKKIKENAGLYGRQIRNMENDIRFYQRIVDKTEKSQTYTQLQEVEKQLEEIKNVEKIEEVSPKIQISIEKIEKVKIEKIKNDKDEQLIQKYVYPETEQDIANKSAIAVKISDIQVQQMHSLEQKLNQLDMAKTEKLDQQKPKRFVKDQIETLERQIAEEKNPQIIEQQKHTKKQHQPATASIVALNIEKLRAKLTKNTEQTLGEEKQNSKSRQVVQSNNHTISR